MKVLYAFMTVVCVCMRNKTIGREMGSMPFKPAPFCWGVLGCCLIIGADKGGVAAKAATAIAVHLAN